MLLEVDCSTPFASWLLFGITGSFLGHIHIDSTLCLGEVVFAR